MRILFSFLLICAGHLFSQSKYSNYVHLPNAFNKIESDSIYELSKFIDTPELKRIITFLASDSCQGRELGTRGNDIASNFISKTYEEYGIPKVPSLDNYFQEVKFSWHSWESTSFEADDFEYKQIWDYIAIPQESNSLKVITDSIIFLGYGIEYPGYNDYLGVDVRGKTILIYNGEPRRKNGTYHISGNSEPSDWSHLDRKIKSAYRNGVKCILIVEENFKKMAEENRSSLYSPVVVLASQEIDLSKSVNRIHVSSTMISKVLGSRLKKLISARDKINKSGRPKSVIFNIPLKIKLEKNYTPVEGKNILAYFEGTDKKEELVVVTAHYDHIGMRGQDVFNGADDNGSGSTGLIQIARTLHIASIKGWKPKRSILCMHVTGEEKGLLGSMFYVNSPVFPLNKTMANINIDMIGRTDEKYNSAPKYSYVIGSDRLSKDLHELNEKINIRYSQLVLDYTYNAEDDPNRYYYRSDHYNFAEKGIPAIFFFSGVHEDYHRITDDVEKIKFEKYRDLVRHVFLLTWGLANREESLKLNADN